MGQSPAHIVESINRRKNDERQSAGCRDVSGVFTCSENPGGESG